MAGGRPPHRNPSTEALRKRKQRARAKAAEAGVDLSVLGVPEPGDPVDNQPASPNVGRPTSTDRPADPVAGRIMAEARENILREAMEAVASEPLRALTLASSVMADKDDARILAGIADKMGSKQATETIERLDTYKAAIDGYVARSVAAMAGDPA